MEEQKRTAIVTGAGKRVGAEIARGLVRDGWAVVAHVHYERDAVPDGSVKAVADLADPACADAIFAAAKALPPVRLLVNNAARFAWDSLDDFSPDELSMHMAINVQAPILLSQHFAREHTDGEARGAQSRLFELYIVEECSCRIHRPFRARTRLEGAQGEWNCAGADAPVDGSNQRKLPLNAQQQPAAPRS